MRRLLARLKRKQIKQTVSADGRHQSVEVRGVRAKGDLNIDVRQER